LLFIVYIVEQLQDCERIATDLCQTEGVQSKEIQVFSDQDISLTAL